MLLVANPSSRRQGNHNARCIDELAGENMKKTRTKIIIKTKKGGFTKLYANGKWQKKVYNLEFQANILNGKVNIVCVYDKYKTDKNGLVICDKATSELLKEHCSIII